ncbi:MAG: isochorismatase, partial [Gammaproteobacteria bacterium]
MADNADKNYAGVWDGRLGFGKKSAIIVIDLLQGYTTEGSALYAPGVVDCVREMPDFLDLAREKGVPIIHTRVLYTLPNYEDGGIW